MMTALRLPAMETHARVNGGGTFDHSGEPVTSGIAVAFEVLGTSPHFPADTVALALDHAVPGECVGLWWDHENNVWEVDRTYVFDPSLEVLALAAARGLGERYVYDLTNEREVAV
jgi:hypothetical protein